MLHILRSLRSLPASHGVVAALVAVLTTEPVLTLPCMHATGGSANHTHSVLFCPVERRFPYIRIQTRQVGGHALLEFTAGQASKKHAQ